eukprot:TRINITY_DN105229_c0_g1_i1.p1 TRINITY_DN105229_c0_g1~~TRINITY_DN105229_c0_g1_i1.p1  ORF type:complete len:900 (-),score=85.31 TRINITY_DN105229_c0_g1_i1:1091-3790(-)
MESKPTSDRISELAVPNPAHALTTRVSIAPIELNKACENYEPVLVENTPLWKFQLDSMLRSYAAQIILAGCTLYALFFNSIKLIAIPKEYDNLCSSLSIIVLLLMAVEVVAAFLCRMDYRWTFFFFVDTLCVISMIFDIHWIVPDNTLKPTEDYVLSFRIIRALIFFRFIRFIRLKDRTTKYKRSEAELDKLKEEAVAKKLEKARDKCKGVLRKERIKDMEKPKVVPVKKKKSEDNTVDIKTATQSKLSKIVQGKAIMHSFMIIIPALILSRLFLLENYSPNKDSIQWAVDLLDQSNNVLPEKEFETLCIKVTEMYKTAKFPLIFLTGPGCPTFIDPDTEAADLRDSEKETTKTALYIVVIDKRPYTHLCGVLNLCRIIFACIVLITATMWGTHYNRQNITIPIAIMIEKVNILNKNPMAFLESDLGQLGVYHHLESADENSKSTNMKDIAFLENAFTKIAKLLAIVYGEAGSEMIANNTRKSDSVTPIIPGCKIHGIFGFIKIADFESITVALQEKILVFTNLIAEVIHPTVEKYFGTTNKNLGDTFFVLWKFRPEDIDETEGGLVAKPYISSTIADLALLTYLKIIAKLHKLEHIIEMKESIEKEINKPVELLFGLHIGWSIEGPIGSVHKIDASYLSPNVNIAARTESVCSQYGVKILITGQLYNILSKHARDLCREIDTVALKGSKLPISLFTVDLNLSNLTHKKCKYEDLNHAESKKRRTHTKKIFQCIVKNDTNATYALYTDDKDLKSMREDLNQAFIENFKEGYNNYIEGKWDIALQYINAALKENPNDGPSMVLKNYMERRGKAPEDWKGYRELSQKQHQFTIYYSETDALFALLQDDRYHFKRVIHTYNKNVSSGYHQRTNSTFTHKSLNGQTALLIFQRGSLSSSQESP